MKIYVGHPTDLPFREELYEPLRQSSIAKEHKLMFPHKSRKELFDSKSFLRDDCDLFLAEVSLPSTGLGIELGWANGFEVQVMAFYRKGSEPSVSIEAVTNEIREYQSPGEMVNLVKEILDSIEDVD